MSGPRIEDYSHRSMDKLRYGDTDRQGHINNAVFTTFFETGRVELLFGGHIAGMPPEGCEIVIANISVDFRAEVLWPGEVTIGTRIARVGRSSIGLEQALFQGDTCAATAKATLVLIDVQARRPTPLSEETVAALQALCRAE